MSKRAVLMMTFGSPEEITYEGVAEFFTNIRRGVRPEPHKIQTLHDNYLRIGGTPLQRITREEVDLVASALGEQVSVYFANKFSRSFITDVITQMENDGIEECLCLILEPHYSYYSVMGYEKFLESEHIRFQIIKDWYREPSLLHYWADEIRKILDQIGDDSYKVIFSAHSVPVLALDFGDPYIDQIYDNSRLIAEDLGLREEQYTNTWQSESDIGIPWIKPDVLEYLRDEKECKELCQELGVAYHRPPMPNRDPRLIKALLSAIQSHIDGDYSYYQPQLETFDELETPSSTGQILDEEKDIQMPDFVKKLIAKKGLENVKMPYLFKKMLEKKYGKKYD